MWRKLFFRPWVLLIIGFVVIFIFSTIVVFSDFYNGFFRVSQSQALLYLKDKKSPCDKISDCDLLPGDILIRKYMTERIFFIDRFFDMFFTHSAFYLGNDELFEVFGPEKDPADDVQILLFQKTDWLNPDIENFVIIRPRHYSQKLEKINKKLRFIAEGSNYRFGLPFYGPQRITCADVIFNELQNNGVVRIEDVPKTITPDYLFWIAINNPNDFEIVGYKIGGQ